MTTPMTCVERVFDACAIVALVARHPSGKEGSDAGQPPARLMAKKVRAMLAAANYSAFTDNLSSDGDRWNPSSHRLRRKIAVGGMASWSFRHRSLAVSGYI